MKYLMSKTRTRCHAINYDGTEIYVSDLLSYGNDKLSSNIAIFDLPAIETCLNCGDCKHDCYAMKAQRQYPDTYTKRALNYYIAEKRPYTFEALVVCQLAYKPRPYVRIHSSGDFFSQEYIDAWARIVATFPEIQFYSYTKVDHLFDFSNLTSLSNFNLVRSVLPCGSQNFGPKKDIIHLAKKHKAAVCPYGLINQKVKCGDKCRACMTREHVVFLQH